MRMHMPMPMQKSIVKPTHIGVHVGADFAVKNTLHHALGPFLVVAQYFGVLPLNGVWPTADVTRVSFPRPWSPAMLVTCFIIGLSLLDVFLSIRVVAQRGLKLSTVGPMSFATTCLSAYVVFLLLARNWPDLIRATRRCEQRFLQKCYASAEALNFSRRLRRTGSLFIGVAIVEHLNYICSSLYGNHLQIKQCNITMNFWESYFLRERLQIFSIINYTPWLIPLVEWITIAMTFVWNFVDFFLILVCKGLVMRIDQVHWRIQGHVQQRMPASFWQEIRLDLLTLTDLLHQYDKQLSSLILLACSHNMYFLCVQVFHTFEHKGNFMNEIYFWYSLLYVTVRFLTMMFSASAVHDASKAILVTLYEIPTDFWCVELKRLNELLVSDNLALSGKGFFFLTRKLIIAMAGTIVVYELVLIDQVDEGKDQIDRCSRAGLLRTF